MVCVAGVKFIGKRSGEGQRGQWYQLALMNDGDTLNMRCTEKVFKYLEAAEFGDDLTIQINLRNFRGDWVPYIEHVESQE